LEGRQAVSEVAELTPEEQAAWLALGQRKKAAEARLYAAREAATIAAEVLRHSRDQEEARVRYSQTRGEENAADRELSDVMAEAWAFGLPPTGRYVSYRDSRKPWPGASQMGGRQCAI
jgi:hypothetical protein